MRYLHAGRILRVNLTDRAVKIDPMDPYERFIGGKGINIKLLFDMWMPPQNLLMRRTFCSLVPDLWLAHHFKELVDWM